MRTPLVLTSLALVSLSQAGGDATAQAKAAINKNYQGIAKALIANDLEKFAGYMTDDFKQTAPKGASKNKKEVVRDFHAQRERMSDIKWTKTIEKISVDKAGAHVTVKGHMVAKINVGDNKPHTMDLTATSVDDWVKPSEGWKLKQSKATSLTVKVDGKLQPSG